jgi:peptidyl-dipeptidase Dcp
MKNTLFIVFITYMLFAGCKMAEKSDNPFLNNYDTPFGVPPFEKIKAAHFMPAYLKGFEEQRAEIKAIINNPDKPDFENTIKALEYSGQLLTRVSRVFGQPRTVPSPVEAQR